MKLAFWRRARGRHALGAAVTSIPGFPAGRTTMPPVAPPAPTWPVLAVPGPVPAGPAPVVPAQAAASPALSVPVPSSPVAPAGPRIELGFRDGTRATLDPSSEQSRALEDIAAVLTRKD